MKKDRLERFDAHLFTQIDPLDALGTIGGYTAILTYKPTLINGQTDSILYDARTDA